MYSKTCSHFVISYLLICNGFKSIYHCSWFEHVWFWQLFIVNIDQFEIGNEKAIKLYWYLIRLLCSCMHSVCYMYVIAEYFSLSICRFHA